MACKEDLRLQRYKNKINQNKRSWEVRESLDEGCETNEVKMVGIYFSSISVVRISHNMLKLMKPSILL